MTKNEIETVFENQINSFKKKYGEIQLKMLKEEQECEKIIDNFSNAGTKSGPPIFITPLAKTVLEKAGFYITGIGSNQVIRW